jgi:hypothetical protein
MTAVTQISEILQQTQLIIQTYQLENGCPDLVKIHEVFEETEKNLAISREHSASADHLHHVVNAIERLIPSYNLLWSLQHSSSKITDVREGYESVRTKYMEEISQIQEALSNDGSLATFSKIDQVDFQPPTSEKDFANNSKAYSYGLNFFRKEFHPVSKSVRESSSQTSFSLPSLAGHIYNSDMFHISGITPYQENGEVAFTNTSLPPKEDLKWPHNPQVKLEIRVKDKTYSSHGTLVGPHHILTSCTPICDPQQKTWADEILVSTAKTYPVVKVYTFSEWTQKQNPHYNIALLILGKSIGKHTGWSGMLSIPDSFLQDERVHILKVPHLVQKVEPDEIRCTPKLNTDQVGTALSANHWKTSMMLGLVTLDRDQKPLALRLSKQKVEAVARIISENYKPISKFAFGKRQWAKYFGDVGEEPPLPPNIEEILKAQCPIWPDKKVYETHLLTLIPKTVNGQPLTLKTLGELVQKPLQGPSSKFEALYLGQYQDVPPKHSHWTLLSRDVIPDSRNKPYANQQKLVQQYPGYEVPHILDTAVALFMEHTRSGVRLYSDAPWTYTRCQEKYNNQWQLVVGGFAVGGLRVDYIYDDLEDGGVGVARKFH